MRLARWSTARSWWSKAVTLRATTCCRRRANMRCCSSNAAANGLVSDDDTRRQCSPLCTKPMTVYWQEQEDTLWDVVARDLDNVRSRRELGASRMIRGLPCNWLARCRDALPDDRAPARGATPGGSDRAACQRRHTPRRRGTVLALVHRRAAGRRPRTLCRGRVESRHVTSRRRRSTSTGGRAVPGESS